MDIKLRDELAKEIFEEVKPSNPHGPQDDLYFGMPYCSNATAQARRIADRILSKFTPIEPAPKPVEDTDARELVEKTQAMLLERFSSSQHQPCTPGCPSAPHIHQMSRDEALLLKLATALELKLPTPPNPAEPVVKAIQKIREENLRGERASITFDPDELDAETDLDGDPITKD